MLQFFNKNKVFKILLTIIVLGYAIVGFFLTSVFFAVKLHITDDPGSVDKNDRFLAQLDKERNNNFSLKDSSIYPTSQLAYKIMVLSEYSPKNAQYITNAFMKTRNYGEVERMLDAVGIYLKDNYQYQEKLKKVPSNINTKINTDSSLFEWMNIPEWQVFKEAVLKEKKSIDSACKVVGVEPRLLVSVLVGEQIRLFNSSREAFKKWISPLKILSTETKFSLGVTGIKEETAIKIEKYLKDKSSPFYLGVKYENLLDFTQEDITKERYDKLTCYKNHYYQYLYAAINLKQLNYQWKRSGYDISSRPEVLATLYNVGFPSSVPKAEPKVGGSTIMINNIPYTFGLISYEFYYSGELFDLFPFANQRFID